MFNRVFHFEGISRYGKNLIIDACNLGDGWGYEVMAMEPNGEEYASARVSSSVEAGKVYNEFLRRFVVGFEIRENEKYGSLEIAFDCKPCENVRDMLKSMRFRWNGRLGIWYGFADYNETFNALYHACYGCAALADASTDNAKEKPAKKPTKKSAPVLAPLFERCDVSSIPDHNPDGVYIDGKTIAADVRAHLKARFPECKFSVRLGRSTYTQAINAYITAAPYGKIEVRNDPRYNGPHMEPGEELAAVLAYCRAYLNSWNYDRSDSMSDYFDVCFYGDFYVAGSQDFVFVEPSEEIRADIRAFHAAKLAKEEAETAAFLARQEAEAKAAAEAAAKEAADIAAIVAGAVVEDIPEENQLCYYGLIGGHGKECCLDELTQNAEAEPRGAIVSRSVSFDACTYGLFCNYFLNDFDFFAGMGGTRTFDSRVTDENFSHLTAEQAESVVWVMCDCVAIYCDGVLKLVIDPEGHAYARYVYLVENPETAPASELEAEAAAAVVEPFYIPAPLSEQAAQLTAGETVTVLTVDPWLMAAQHITGELVAADALPYAQHSDALRLTIRRGRKTLTLWIYGDHETAVYSGILPDVPHGLKYEDISGAPELQRTRFAGADVRQYMIDCINYYSRLGYAPVVDNIPR